MTENHTLELLEAIRNDIADIKSSQETTNLRLASLEDKLSGETPYHLALRDEVASLKARITALTARMKAAVIEIEAGQGLS